MELKERIEKVKAELAELNKEAENISRSISTMQQRQSQNMALIFKKSGYLEALEEMDKDS